jgi:hypothetical protein
LKSKKLLNLFKIIKFNIYSEVYLRRKKSKIKIIKLSTLYYTLILLYYLYNSFKMSYNTSIQTNITQNKEDFKLDLINQPNLFRSGYLIKELDPIQEDPTRPRTVIIYYSQKNCK